MAYSSTTGFRFRKSLYGGDLPAAQEFRVANSTTLKLGDAVRVNTGGFLVRAAAANPVLGILIGLYNQDGINPFSLGADAVGATLTEDDQVATGSANQTAATYIKGAVVVDPAGVLLWYNDANGNFTIANDLQLCDVVAASGQIDQGTVSDTSGQFQLISRDPDGDGDLSKGLFRIAEPQLISQIGNQTTAEAVNAA